MSAASPRMLPKR